MELNCMLVYISRPFRHPESVFRHSSLPQKKNALPVSKLQYHLKIKFNSAFVIFSI